MDRVAPEKHNLKCLPLLFFIIKDYFVREVGGSDAKN